MKRVLTIVLVFILCMNNFAAIVSDNDGSAFVTKGEFDALKRDFVQQVQNYNDSIDSKIDGAIAAYLDALRLAQTINLSLDSKCKYTFPLYYDPNYYWDNYNISGGQKISIPEFHKIKYYSTAHGLIVPESSGDKANWGTVNKTTGQVSVSQTAIWNSAYDNCMSVMTTCRWKNDYSGQNGLLNMVTRTSDTRKINGTNYNVYSLDDEGIGKFIYSYAATATTNSGNGNMFANSDSYSTGSGSLIAVHKDNQLTVTGSGKNLRYSVKAGTGATAVMTKSSCYGAGGSWGNQTGVASIAQNSKMTAKALSETIYSYGGDSSNSKYNRDLWTAKPLAESAKYSTPNVRRYIFSRALYMPANANYDVALTADLQKGDDTRFTIVGGGANVLTHIVGFSKTAKTTYNKSQLEVMALPPLKRYIWHTSTKYVPGTSESFSYLPASVVTYKDSNDKTHYMDEGMFLGTMESSGEVSFKVKFKKYSNGTGTGGSRVQLHVSKVPFANGYNTSNYETFYVNTTKSTAINVNYDTEYTVRIPNVSKGDELYFEWIPVTGTDLAALFSFSNFKMVTYD